MTYISKYLLDNCDYGGEKEKKKLQILHEATFCELKTDLRVSFSINSHAAFFLFVCFPESWLNHIYFHSG